MNETSESFLNVEILGVQVNAMTMSLALAAASRAVETGDKTRFAFCTVHTLVESQNDERLRIAVSESIACPDGMPLVWLARRHAKWTTRVYGPDSMLAFCEAGVEKGWRHFFYGSSDATVQQLADRMRQRFPGIEIVGSYSPPFRELTTEEDEAIITMINEAKPDFVWIGLGMPKQELWMAEHQHSLDAPVLAAVGAAFDFHAGVKRQAPTWMQKRGLEWLFRLSQEPTRLWRRYLVGNSRFLWLLLRRPQGRNS